MKRLHDLGCKHLFGVGGDFVLGFMEPIHNSSVKQINCCNELNAAYALMDMLGCRDHEYRNVLLPDLLDQIYVRFWRNSPKSRRSDG